MLRECHTSFSVLLSQSRPGFAMKGGGGGEGRGEGNTGKRKRGKRREKEEEEGALHLNRLHEPVVLLLKLFFRRRDYQF